jgi:hypothetical protein
MYLLCIVFNSPYATCAKCPEGRILPPFWTNVRLGTQREERDRAWLWENYLLLLTEIAGRKCRLTWLLGLFIYQHQKKKKKRAVRQHCIGRGNISPLRKAGGQRSSFGIFTKFYIKNFHQIPFINGWQKTHIHMYTYVTSIFWVLKSKYNE